MKTELIKIITELEEIIEEKNLKLSDYEKLDISVRILNTNQINQKKPFFTKREDSPYSKKEYPKTNSLTSQEEKPTESQLKEAKRLGLTIPAGSSKKDVWRLIKERKELKNEN